MTNAARFAAFILLAGTATPVARGQVITWGPATTVSGDSDVNTLGPPVAAYNLGPSGVPATTVNGVTFQPFPVNGSPSTAGNFTITSFTRLFGADTAGSGAAPYSTLSPSYRTLLGSAAFAGVSEGGETPTLTLTMNNMTVGQAYQFQFWSNVSTVFGGGLAGPSAITATGGGGGSVVVNPNTTRVNGGVGQYAIGTFVADAPTQTVTFSGFVDLGADISSGPAVNGFLLTPVPEPTGVLLTAGVAAGLLARHRRAAGR